MSRDRAGNAAGWPAGRRWRYVDEEGYGGGDRGRSGIRGEAGADSRVPAGKPTLYGSLTRRGLSAEGVPDIAASEGFVVGAVTKKSILVSCPHENVSTKFLAPYTTFCRIHQKSITCLDISSGGGLGVSTSTDGTMKIWQAANGEIRVRASGFAWRCCVLMLLKSLSRNFDHCGLGQAGEKLAFDCPLQVASWEKQIYTCCRDGMVRRYQLSDL
nr:PREDICTED: proteasomal ATPase-associated factor 1 [Apteryx mantelli mantelli]